MDTLVTFAHGGAGVPIWMNPVVAMYGMVAFLGIGLRILLRQERRPKGPAEITSLEEGRERRQSRANREPAMEDGRHPPLARARGAPR